MRTSRTGYIELRERLNASALPYDDEAERCAIGAMLVAPAQHAKRFGKRLWKEHFYLDQHGWLWERLTYAVSKVEWDDKVSLYLWLRKDQWAQRYRARYGGSLSELVASCLEDGFWWHGIYYCDRVMAAAKARARIKRAAGDLSEALNVADEGWHRRDWT